MAKRHSVKELIKVLLTGLLIACGLLGYSFYLDKSITNIYLLFNVGLATVPLLIAWRLVVVLKNKLWSAWEPLLLSFIWLLFLPNSFYMVSDFAHIQEMSSTATIFFDSIVYSAFIFLSVIMGITSLYLVHRELKRRLRDVTAWLLVLVVLFVASFAFYLGRDLRWNSWSVFTDPGGLLFDVSAVLLNRADYGVMIQTVIGFFAFISSTYWICWTLAQQLWLRGASDMVAHIRRRQPS